MDLASKLRRFLPQQNDTVAPVRPKSGDLDPFLHGQEVDTPFGVSYVVEERWPLTKRHGHWALKEALGTDYSSLRFEADHFDLKSALFLDTETTGLSGGTGTYAFLVGLGYFTHTHFVVKQLLMRDYNEELALLYLLNQELQAKNSVITFNGKAFDLPLLHTRFTISRLGLAGTAQKKHIDLLHMSRRLWKHKLDSCSLGSLETHILGVQRVGDIPGMEIPGRYFEFLQTGGAQLLQGVLEHNVLDIVSMATLLYRLQTTTELEPEECDCSFEAEALAQRSLIKGEHARALQYLEAAGQLTEDDQQYLRVLRLVAAIFKRLGQLERAVVLWKRVMEISPDDLATSEELAKYYEHKKKDLASAEQITRRALALAWQNR
ncbi:MAG: ribonuclease H-like domain-containing protein, partial [Limnochordia bacterium]|nr:ribonuclease H-like domain-containing protein [Limnochordia bacterium]